MAGGRRVLLSFALGILLAAPLVAWAAGATGTWEEPVNEEVKINPIIFSPQISIPGFESGKPVTEDTLGNYFRAIYVYFISSVGAIAVAMIIFGGFRWITAAGNASKIQAAQETINSALIGVVLALTSFLILNTINPNLTRLRIPAVTQVQQLLQTTYFCKDGSPAAREAGKSRTCGDNVEYTETDGRKRNCVATYVNPNTEAGTDGAGNPIRTKDSLICAYNKQTNGFAAVSIYKLCTDTDYTTVTECERADRQITSDLMPDGKTPKPPLQLPGTATAIACRRYSERGYGDRCVLNPVEQCPGNFERVKCDVLGGQNTVCWQNGGPALYGANEVVVISQTYCSNSNRAAVVADAICCKATVDLAKQCQEEKPAGAISSLFNRFTYDQLGYAEFPASDCGPTCNSKCWILLKLEGKPRHLFQNP